MAPASGTVTETDRRLLTRVVLRNRKRIAPIVEGRGETPA